jgi:hypothetical protein
MEPCDPSRLIDLSVYFTEKHLKAIKLTEKSMRLTVRGIQNKTLLRHLTPSLNYLFNTFTEFLNECMRQALEVIACFDKELNDL